ncbi:MAG: hypothetical protein AB7Q29_07390 [Vicinamibacterales bacterium]
MSLIVATIGGAALAVGAFIDPAQAAFSYLTAFVSVAGILVAALMLVLIQHVIGATWFVVMRRATEDVTAALPVLIPLFVPIAVGMHWLYPWVHPADLDEVARESVLRKSAYLNTPFFLVRSAAYLASWVIVGDRLRRWSLDQDGPSGRVWRWDSPDRIGGPALILLAFTLAFAAIDWVMSLSPDWYSTIFGVQLFAGAMVGALGLLAVLADTPGHTTLSGAVSAEHRAAIGKMILTFATFWAYVSFAQLLIVWIGDLPVEIRWYLPRARGSWLAFGLAVAFGHFVVPVVAMVPHAWKRRASILRRLGVWLLFMHYADVYWLVTPARHPGGVALHWLDAAALATVAGIVGGVALWRARDHARIPIGDPSLDRSLRYSGA